MITDFLFSSGRGHYHRNRKKENLITWLVAVLVVAGLLGWNYINRKASNKTASETSLQEQSEISVSDGSEEYPVEVAETFVDDITEPVQIAQALDDNTFSYADAIALCESFSLEAAYEPITVNNNIPTFEDSEIYENSFEYYAPLDDQGRAVFAMACIGQELMPTEDRPEEITIDPSGWHSVPASDVENGWLYNRCHLIAYCLTAEGDNENNFVTGTRNLNVEGMLPYEEAVAEVLDDNPGIHIMYRVTPIFSGSNLVCNGVLMEAYSVEDNGQLVCFCAFCPNTQPNWTIHYDTGFADPEVA